MDSNYKNGIHILIRTDSKLSEIERLFKAIFKISAFYKYSVCLNKNEMFVDSHTVLKGKKALGTHSKHDLN